MYVGNNYGGTWYSNAWDSVDYQVGSRDGMGERTSCMFLLLRVPGSHLFRWAVCSCVTSKAPAAWGERLVHRTIDSVG